MDPDASEDDRLRPDDTLSRVAGEVIGCTKCPLALTRTNAVPGEGSAGARIVMIGEGPGRNEDLKGRPFVGAAGKQLDGLLKEAGLTREDVFITNVVKCRPPENRRPTSAEADACQPYLDRQLALIRPRVVVLLGDTALKRFLEDESLKTAHGKSFDVGEFEVFPTYHPAAMIYNPALERVTADDFRKLGRTTGASSGRPKPS